MSPNRLGDSRRVPPGWVTGPVPWFVLGITMVVSGRTFPRDSVTWVGEVSLQ